MRNRQTLIIAAIVVVLGLAGLHGTNVVQPARAADTPLPGSATLSGTLQAPTPFKAAQVHLMNLDKNVLFMVYTRAGSTAR